MKTVFAALLGSAFLLAACEQEEEGPVEETGEEIEEAGEELEEAAEEAEDAAEEATEDTGEPGRAFG